MMSVLNNDGLYSDLEQFGNTVMPYAGQNGMYEVHKFMALDAAEVGYFIQQVGLSAASFGVSSSDVAAVGSALMGAFGYRCEPPASIPSFEPPALQSICTEVSKDVVKYSSNNADAMIVRLSSVSKPRLRRLWPGHRAEASAVCEQLVRLEGVEEVVEVLQWSASFCLNATSCESGKYAAVDR